MEEEYEAMLATQYNKLQEQNQESKYIRDMQIEELTKQLAEQLKRNKELESALNNSVSKDEIKKVIKENERVKNLAKEQLAEEVIIADSDSLNCGRIEGHNFAIHMLQELLNKGE